MCAAVFVCLRACRRNRSGHTVWQVAALLAILAEVSDSLGPVYPEPGAGCVSVQAMKAHAKSSVRHQRLHLKFVHWSVCAPTSCCPPKCT
jgi:hypothetical protein